MHIPQAVQTVQSLQVALDEESLQELAVSGDRYNMDVLHNS